jgi:hypothetical protein
MALKPPRNRNFFFASGGGLRRRETAFSHITSKGYTVWGHDPVRGAPDEEKVPRSLRHHLLHTRAMAGIRNVGQTPSGTVKGTYVGRLWCSPVHCEEVSRLVSWQLKKSLPCYHRSSQPPLGLQLQARGSSADARHFRRAWSARASRRPRRHVARLVSQRSAGLCKCIG